MVKKDGFHPRKLAHLYQKFYFIAISWNSSIFLVDSHISDFYPAPSGSDPANSLAHLT